MQQKHFSFSMQIGLWLSLAAMLATASNPFSNPARVAGKDAQPVTPAGWSDPIVLTKAVGTNTSDTTLEAGSSVYVDVAVVNNGIVAIAETFQACLYLDDTLVYCWDIAGLAAGATTEIEDYEITYAAHAVQEGSHILQLRVDEAVAIITESNTTNNTFTADFTWTESNPTTTAGALDSGDTLTVPNDKLPLDNNTDSDAPDQRDIASYMIGKVVVSVVLPESTTGVNKENWSAAEIQQVKNEITEGLGDWETWYTANNGGNPGLDFVIEWHTNADAEPVEIPNDIVSFVNGQGDQDVWVNEILEALSAPANSEYLTRAYDYNNALRTANSANWAFTIIVADSSADTDGRLTAGGDFPTTGPYAYSYLNGPFIVMTYDNKDWGINQMSEVLARHVGHIFGAANQYPTCPSGTFGYLAITNTCLDNTTDLMFSGQGTPDVTTRQQVGWKDTDNDQIFDPADTRPLIIEFIDESFGFTGTNHLFSGKVRDNPLSSGRPVTIRKIIAIQYRIDGGAWQNATITSGTLDSDYEEFDFATPNNLGGGTHVVELRVQNNSTDPTNKYSILTPVPSGTTDALSSTDSYIKMIFSSDYFASAIIVPSLPYTSPATPKINTTGFHGGGNVPEAQDQDLRNCLGDPNVDRNAGDHSAWFVYTPTQTESITLDTIGSNFDTMIGAYRYVGNGDLSQINCDDDSGGSLKSLVTVAVTQGVTYYFNVSSFTGTPDTNLPKVPGFFLEKADLGALSGNFDPGGDLVFHIVSNGIITNAPTVVSSTRVNPNPTNFATVHFKVTFSANVTGVEEGDFTLTKSGVSGAAVSGVSGSGNVYDVSVSTGTGNGSIRLNVINNGSIQDTTVDNNPLAAGFTTGQTYLVDKTSPYVLSSSRTDPDPTTAAIVKYAVTFSQPVSGVNASDFVFHLAGSGVSTAAVVGITPASGLHTIYTVSVSTGTGNGTIRLEVANDHTIVNATANSLFSGFTGGETYRIKRTAIFDDVPFTYWANDYVERLFYAGVTGGCGTGIYCPDSAVTRAQMAVFLLKAIHGSSYAPPAVGASTSFSDVPVGYWADKWIKQLAAEGITGGCGAGVYCPDTTVTRAQMAVFLLKSKHGSSYAPPAATGVFADVPIGYWADKWIERLAVEGVTSGCGSGLYCPDAEVTRAQMAVFLVKAFNMP